MEKYRKIYSNTAALLPKDLERLKAFLETSPKGIYREAFDIGIMGQTLYRLLRGQGAHIETVNKVLAHLKKHAHNQPVEAA